MATLKVLGKSNLFVNLKDKVMQVQHFIGADISKKTIDFAIHQGGHFRTANCEAGFKDLLIWLQKEQVNVKGMLIVMEHTGLYSYPLERFLHHNELAFTKVSPLQIKLSMGMVRGKTDKIDARRIARYGFQQQAELQPCLASAVRIQRLKLLKSTRDRLVKNRAALKTALKETRAFCDLATDDILVKSQEQLIVTLSSKIALLEAEIQKTIKADADINRNYQLITSVPGVGQCTATESIITTENFSKFKNARKFACYCGVAPFEHTSGSSIHRKTKVSQLANKRMKSLLDAGAKSVINYDKELRSYYQKRIESGKSKMSTINIIRNKIIFRMFAVINRQTDFIKVA